MSGIENDSDFKISLWIFVSFTINIEYFSARTQA